MPPKAGKDKAEMQSAADKHVLAESKRLQDIAYEGMISKTRRMCTNELMPSKVLTKADGKDITKKSSARKGRYLLNINAKIAALAAGRMGALAQLDSKNPVLYIDFPEGRLKFFGTLMFPSNKYMVLKFTNKDILCDDILESMVIFSEAWWIGKKEDNPDEFRLPLPQRVIEAGRKAQETDQAVAADEGKGTQGTANGRSTAGRGPGKRALTASERSDVSSGASSQGDEDVPLTQGRRMSQRSTKRPKYNVDASESDREEEEVDDDDENEEDLQRVKRRAPARSPAEGVKQSAAERDAGPSQPGLSRSQRAAEDGDPSAVPAMKASAAKAVSTGTLKQATLNFGKAAQVTAKDSKPPRQKPVQSTDSDVVDLSSPLPSQRSRPTRAVSAKKATLKEASSGSDGGDDHDLTRCERLTPNPLRRFMQPVGPGGSEVFRHQQTITLGCKTYYLRIFTCFEGAEIKLSSTLVRSAIQQSLREVFGVIGGAINFDVLEVKEETKQAFLKVDRRDLQTLRVAITLLTSYDGTTCHFQVEATSPFLASLAKDSRAFTSQLPFPC
ncbi:g2406 [Coccomyxa elongata]